jgi:ABC-type glycerol-3-phosphate transport system substrate-binding protein
VGPERIAALSKAMEGQSWGAFGAGRQGMTIAWADEPVSEWKINPAHTYKYSWLPVAPSRKGTKIAPIGGHAGTILKGSRNQDVTFKFIVFLTQADACNIIFDKVGWIGPRKSYQDSLDLSVYPDHIREAIWFFTRTMRETADEVWIENDPLGDILYEEWRKMRESVIYGELTAEQAATRMQENLTKELANWQKLQQQS